MSLINSYPVGDLILEVHAQTSDFTQHPTVRIPVNEPLRILGGGAFVNWHGEGNLLTAAYPESDTVWIASSKDHGNASFATITGYCLAAKLSNGARIGDDDYILRQNESVPDHHPETEATLPNGFELVGGGAWANWHTWGQLLTASYPVGNNTWRAASKDHGGGIQGEFAEAATLTAYAIGLKASFVSGLHLKIDRQETSSTATNHPSIYCSLDQGYRLLCGGARSNAQGAGSLLTATYPKDEHTWFAASKDHRATLPNGLVIGDFDASTITAFAIGIKA